LAVTQKPDGRWAVYYRDGKKVKWEYFGRGAEGEAAAYKRNGELGLGRRARRRKPSGPMIAHLAKAYFDSKTDINPNSKKMLKIRLEANLLPHFGHIRATNLTDKDVDRYVKKRRAAVKDSTINRELTDLKAILNWSTRRKPPLLQRNPIRTYQKPPSDDEIILPPTRDELQRILAAAKPHLLRALLLSYYLGLRPGAVELLTLHWWHVNWDTNKILVIGAAKGLKKQARQRMVPIHPALCEQLKIWEKEDKPSWPIVHYRGRPIKKLQTTWEQCRRDAKLTRRIRLYDLRHAHVTRALEAGADIGAISINVGSRPETLRKHYQHVTERLQGAAIDAVPALPAILKPACIAKKTPKKRKKSSALKSSKPFTR
jgi:integrase